MFNDLEWYPDNQFSMSNDRLKRLLMGAACPIYLQLLFFFLSKQLDSRTHRLHYIA